MDEKLQQEGTSKDKNSFEKRPGIIVVGAPNVGKRTLISRLLSKDLDNGTDTPSDVLTWGWTINTKYYVADVSVWIVHLSDEFSISDLPISNELVALVMVFDTNDLFSFAVLKDWVSRTDIGKFDILLCIGNKVDLIPGHSAHTEYRRRLMKLGESSGNFLTEFSDYGISETEGSSLLGDEEPSMEVKRYCLDWCLEHNIEYIEACGSNADFDKCLSMDGDSQGVERLYGALSAHMWPGMVLKSGDKIIEPSLPEGEELTDEGSDYELEYEILSAGSAEPWNDTDEGWVSANGPTEDTVFEERHEKNIFRVESNGASETGLVKKELQASTSASQLHEENDKAEMLVAPEVDRTTEAGQGHHYDFEDLEQLMSEIGNVRDSLRLMPDFQRREMAANLALKMAAMFGDGSEDVEGLE